MYSHVNLKPNSMGANNCIADVLTDILAFNYQMNVVKNCTSEKVGKN